MSDTQKANEMSLFQELFSLKSMKADFALLLQEKKEEPFIFWVFFSLIFGNGLMGCITFAVYIILAF